MQIQVCFFFSPLRPKPLNHLRLISFFLSPCKNPPSHTVSSVFKLEPESSGRLAPLPQPPPWSGSPLSLAQQTMAVSQMASTLHCSESQATGLTLPGARNAVLPQAKGFSLAHLHPASAHVTPAFGWCPTCTLSLLPQPSLVLLPIGHILILQVSA